MKNWKKLSDHQLKARLVYELNNLNQNYTDANALNIEKFYEYLDWFHNLKDEKEQMSFADYQNLDFIARKNFVEEERKNSIEVLKNVKRLKTNCNNLMAKIKKTWKEQLKNIAKTMMIEC